MHFVPSSYISPSSIRNDLQLTENPQVYTPQSAFAKNNEFNGSSTHFRARRTRSNSREGKGEGKYCERKERVYKKELYIYPTTNTQVQREDDHHARSATLPRHPRSRRELSELQVKQKFCNPVREEGDHQNSTLIKIM